MRAVRLLLAASFPVFLVALSFALVTGRVWRPTEARAQATPQFVGLVKSGVFGLEKYFALAADGGLYVVAVSTAGSQDTPSSWQIVDAAYLGSVAAGPVPASASSWGGLKAGGERK